MSYPYLANLFLFLLIIYVWWSLSRKIAELESKLSGVNTTGTPKCCEDLKIRVDKIVSWLKGQYAFNRAIDDAICALEKMANEAKFSEWEKSKSNCGYSGGGDRVPPPTPEPDF